MDAGWEIEVPRYGSGEALVAPAVWYAAFPNREDAEASVRAAAADQLGPMLLSVKRCVGIDDLAAIGVLPGQAWKWRKTAVAGGGSGLGDGT